MPEHTFPPSRGIRNPAFDCLTALYAEANGYPTWFQHAWITSRQMSFHPDLVREMAARVTAALKRGATIEEATELANVLAKEMTRA